MRRGDEWTKLQVGARVDYHARIGGPVTSTGHVVTAIATIPSSRGVPLAWISGKAGCVSLAALSPALERRSV